MSTLKRKTPFSTSPWEYRIYTNLKNCSDSVIRCFLTDVGVIPGKHDAVHDGNIDEHDETTQLPKSEGL